MSVIYNYLHNAIQSFAPIDDVDVSMKLLPSYGNQVLPITIGANGNQISNSVISQPKPRSVPPAAPKDTDYLSILTDFFFHTVDILCRLPLTYCMIL